MDSLRSPSQSAHSAAYFSYAPSFFRFVAQCNPSTHTLFVCMANAFVCARHVYRLKEGRKFSKKATLATKFPAVKAGQQDRFERGERKRVQSEGERKANDRPRDRHSECPPRAANPSGAVVHEHIRHRRKERVGAGI